MLVIDQAEVNFGGWRRLLEHPVQVHDRTLVAIEVSIQLRVADGVKVFRKVAKRPLCPPVGGHGRSVQQAEQPLEIQVHDRAWQAEVMQRAGESGNAGGWFRRLNHRGIEQEDARTGVMSHEYSSWDGQGRSGAFSKQVVLNRSYR